MRFSILHDLNDAELRQLIASLQVGPLSQGINRRHLQALVGGRAGELETCLREMATFGMAPAQMGLVVQAVLDGYSQHKRLVDHIQLVLSGPDVPEVPCGDTAAVLHSLVKEASTEILLVGYAIHDGEKVFEALASKMDACTSLDVTFCLDVQRRMGDEREAAQLAEAFARRFRGQQWPGTRMPAVFYDPRSIVVGLEKRSALHAKAVVVDRRTALITSANFTEAAQERNIELGVLLRSEHEARRIVEYFHHLIDKGLLARLL